MTTIKCEMKYYPFSGHLSQLYAGFEILKEKGIISLVYSDKYQIQSASQVPLLLVRVNDRYDFCYDVSDGTDWIIGGTKDENIRFLKENIKVDFYFKRSFNELFSNRFSESTKVFPLGLNYQIQPTKQKGIKAVIKSKIDMPFFHKYLKFNNNSFTSEVFEHLPMINPNGKILFLLRLWDPNESLVETSKIKEERLQINEQRINCIKVCKKEFKDKFIGGVTTNDFSIKNCDKDLLLPRLLTSRKSFLDLIKKSNICIATTGLHKSIGWKFGEYVAASRAIVSEPLNYRIPGAFTPNKNYLEFNNGQELIERISFLLDNKQVLQEMMWNNYDYYQKYLRPDIMILHTLLKVL